MCLQCNKDVATECIVVEQLKKVLEKHEYFDLDKITVSLVFIAYAGFNGAEAQQLAESVIQNLIDNYHRLDNGRSVAFSSIQDSEYQDIDYIEYKFLKMKNDPTLKVTTVEDVQNRRREMLHENFYEKYETPYFYSWTLLPVTHILGAITTAIILFGIGYKCL